MIAVLYAARRALADCKVVLLSGFGKIRRCSKEDLKFWLFGEVWWSCSEIFRISAFGVAGGAM